MIYCFTANNRTHFFLHAGVLSLFINNGTELSAFASICPFLAFLMTIWRKSSYFSEGMDSLSLGLVESYFLYALYFWSLTYLSTTSLLMLPREPR